MPNISFYNPIPSSFDPELRNLQYLDLADPMTLPPGKFYHGQHYSGHEPTPDSQYTYAQVFSKGQTQISRLEMPWSDPAALNALIDAGKGYSDVMQNNEIWGISSSGNPELDNQFPYWTDPVNGFYYKLSKGFWPNGPFDEPTARAKGRSSSITNWALHAGEASENTQFASPGWSMWQFYYNELMPRIREKFDNRGIPSLTVHDYLSLGWPAEYVLDQFRDRDRQTQKDMFNKPQEQWTRTDYSPGGTLGETNGVALTFYPGEFTPLEIPTLLAGIYRMEAYKKGLVGKQGIVVASSRNEWRPNNFENTDFTDGVVFMSDKVSVDPSVSVSVSFAGLVHGAGFINWGGASKAKPDDVKNTMRPVFPGNGNTQLWLANGSSQYVDGGFPRGNPNSTYGQYNGSEDMFAWGMQLYNKTWQLTLGGTRAFLKHRKRPVGGGWSEWITPDNTGMNELIDAYYDQRGYVYSELKGNTLSVYWMDNTAGGVKQEIEFIHPTNPNISWNSFVCGNMIHAASINL